MAPLVTAFQLAVMELGEPFDVVDAEDGRQMCQVCRSLPHHSFCQGS